MNRLIPIILGSALGLVATAAWGAGDVELGRAKSLTCATDAGRKITETEWQAFAESLGKTFDRFNVPAKESSELLGMLLPMKADIVGR